MLVLYPKYNQNWGLSFFFRFSFPASVRGFFPLGPPASIHSRREMFTSFLDNPRFCTRWKCWNQPFFEPFCPTRFTIESDSSTSNIPHSSRSSTNREDTDCKPTLTQASTQHLQAIPFIFYRFISKTTTHMAGQSRKGLQGPLPRLAVRCSLCYALAFHLPDSQQSPLCRIYLKNEVRNVSWAWACEMERCLPQASKHALKINFSLIMTTERSCSTRKVSRTRSPMEATPLCVLEGWRLFGQCMSFEWKHAAEFELSPSISY